MNAVNDSQENREQTAPRRASTTLFWIAAAIGALLGLIAYNQNWLG
ncbi:MAG: CrcB family protein [Actinomycetaceae bacterium]|nr:CrcB family protein [Arcanobacterium sp.]MDD7505040.1 CrcB family protein [Actinomycetaceae bacterium]